MFDRRAPHRRGSRRQQSRPPVPKAMKPMLGGHCRAMEGRAVSVFARGRVLYLFLLLPVFHIFLAEGKVNRVLHHLRIRLSTKPPDYTLRKTINGCPREQPGPQCSSS